jgi:nucleotide-binding universal stress UspA family protein
MSLTLKRILVPIDFSEISLTAVDYAAYIAKNTGAEILILHVFESFEQNSKIDQVFDYTELIEKGIQGKLNELKTQRTNLLGINIRTRVVQGKIHNEIDHIATEEKVDLIVMGTHGASGSRHILGSNAYRTVLAASKPVLTVSESKKQIRFKDIVLPIDGSKQTRAKVGMAIDWAKAFDATIHIVALTAFFDELRIDFGKLKKQVVEIEKQMLTAKVPFTSKMMRHQAISDSVLDYSKKIHADLIFIVAERGSRFSDFIIGSAQKNLISSSHIPIISIKAKKK